MMINRSTMNYGSRRDPQHALRTRMRELAASRVRWLLKIPNAPKSLEFLDSPMQYRQHVHARAIDRLSACMPTP
jgi:hypothetical protein